MSEGKPIETAPKDGTEILGLNYNKAVLLVCWTCPDDFLDRDEASCLDDATRYEKDWFCAEFSYGERMGEDELTHWMPLPEPPESA